jgi:predicted ATPase
MDMRIQSFFLQRVRGLPDIRLDFLDRATRQVRPRTVIAGSNGTGKTTILDAIYTLLELAGDGKPRPDWLRTPEAQAEMVVTDLPFAPESSLHIKARNPKRDPLVEPLTEKIRHAEAGLADFPNCLYFPSEGRELQPKQAGQIISEPKDYQWVYRFSDSRKWQGSLESFLVAMDYRDLMAQREGRGGAGEFQEFLKLINDRFLHGKRIVGVDERSFRVLVQAEDGQRFSIEALSSGEKQILLMLAEVQRRLRRGGLLLIDEPEIHLHPRWQRLLVRALTDLCAEHDAQLIITTHSEEVANAAYEHELVLLDAIFTREPLP